MRIRSVARVVGAAATIAVVVACSGTGSQFAPVQPPIAQGPGDVPSLALSGGGIPELASLAVSRASGVEGCNLRRSPLPCRNVYLSSYYDSLISCYDNTDKTGKLFGSQSVGITNPTGETATWGRPDHQRLIVANTGGRNVLEFKGTCANQVIRTIEVTTGGFPYGVAVASDGNIYTRHRRVSRLVKCGSTR